jgi:two-component system response regulator MprA
MAAYGLREITAADRAAAASMLGVRHVPGPGGGRPSRRESLLRHSRGTMMLRSRGRSMARSTKCLFLDLLTRETRRVDRQFALSPKEFDLLAYLLRHPRQVLPRACLLRDVWGYDFGGNDAVLEVYIAYLRTTTEAAGEPRLIQTVRGVGYVLRKD